MDVFGSERFGARYSQRRFTQLYQIDGKPCVGLGVSDTGPGIPEDEQPYLFDRFFRGTVGRESGVPGTGLGLSIVQEIVSKHSGRIDVKSGEPGQGATFTIWVPTDLGDAVRQISGEGPS